MVDVFPGVGEVVFARGVTLAIGGGAASLDFAVVVGPLFIVMGMS